MGINGFGRTGRLAFRAAMELGLDLDVVAVIRGVIQVEAAVIEVYNEVIQLCDGTDYVTQDLCIRCLAEEETHKVEFEGFLKEYETR